MTFWINKIVGFAASPAGIACLSALLAWMLAETGWKRLARLAALFAFAAVYLPACGVVYGWLGRALEAPYLVDGRVPLAEDAPAADAILLLGGSMGANTNVSDYAEMSAGADRVWHAARLYRAEKAPLIICSGFGDDLTTKRLLIDFGVAESALVFEGESRNTEENLKFTAALLRERGVVRPKALMVTSAWHMRRAMLMAEKYAADIEVIPAATDFEACVNTTGPFRPGALLPSSENFFRSSVMIHELVGYFGYRMLRR